MTMQYLLAGFGGQGVLFAGKFLANKGLLEEKQVSWMPSYGPEMRGGTANCSVIISDELIGSPIVSTPDVLAALNQPSLNKFEKAVKKGGTIFVDSSLVNRKVERDDVTVVYIPAARLASDNEVPDLANMILLGKLLSDADEGLIKEILLQSVSSNRQDMIDANLKAFLIGKNYK